MIIPDWPLPKGVHAVTSTRVGGVSTGQYRGLNLGAHVGDDPRHVAENRAVIKDMAAMPSAPVWLNQTHSSDVVTLSEPMTSIIDADASYTGSAGVVCCVMTADCLPILLCAQSGNAVAAVHAGWRGLADGIVEKSVALFGEPVTAWIGPAIGPTAFEVGEEVVRAFVSHHSNAIAAFEPGEQAGKWMGNLSLLAKQRLVDAGVLENQIVESGLCTYSDEETFYSYRRDGQTGRMASFIWLEK
jgi:YfiH family protein